MQFANYGCNLQRKNGNEVLRRKDTATMQFSFIFATQMNIYNQLENLPVFNKAIITIGTFDGVHKGHAKIIQQLKKEAKAVGGTSVLISFYPHPKQVLYPKKNPLFVLNTQEEKLELLEKMGIDNLVIVPFTEAFANQSAMDYIENFLVKYFHPYAIIIGYDHRFGKDRSGDFRLLEQEAERFNFKVKEIPEKLLEDVIISSTKIRDALLDGDLATANAYLGYPYFFGGTVVKGNQMGRTIGFATANIAGEDAYKLIPANGVYAVTVQHENTLYKGMMNIGIRPTINGDSRVTEVHIFNFDKEIYGEKLRIYMHAFIRNEIKFSGLKALKAQLRLDKETALSLLDNINL